MNHLSPAMHLTSDTGDELLSLFAAAGKIGGGRGRRRDGGRAQVEPTHRSSSGLVLVPASGTRTGGPLLTSGGAAPKLSPAARPPSHLGSLLAAEFWRYGGRRRWGPLARLLRSSTEELLRPTWPHRPLLAEDSPSRARIGGGWPPRRVQPRRPCFFPFPCAAAWAGGRTPSSPPACVASGPLLLRSFRFCFILSVGDEDFCIGDACTVEANRGMSLPFCNSLLESVLICVVADLELQ
jgi:hypothetical protein